MSFIPADHLWRVAIAVIPLAAVVALACRLLPCRASTRHTLWLTVLAALLVAPFLPAAPISTWADQVVAALPAREKTTVDSITPITTPSVESKPVRPVPPVMQPRVNTPGLLAPDGRSQPSHVAHPISKPRPRIHDVVSADGLPIISAAPWRDFAANGPTKRSATPGPRPSEAAPPSTRAMSRPRHVARDVAPVHTGETAPTTAPMTAPAHAVSTTPTKTDDRDAGVTWRPWLASARDAVMSIPPIPLWLWGGGAAIGLLTALLQILYLRRLLGQARPASSETERLVSEAARDLGLPAPPTTLMVPGQVSPMVVCGRTPRLLLPVALWHQLDPIGRRAVVYHEVAHLKRRDHWVVWLGLLVGCLYWWHPVVWLARRRLREEADLCCDAWVTTLMPTARRAYAVALLETKSFVCRGFTPAPAVGLGVTTLRTKRFARRLTMVMTHHLTPKMTLSGLLLVAVTATGGWLVTPTLACPPSKERTDEKVKAAIRVKAPKAPKLATAPRFPMAPRVTTARVAPSSPFAVTAPTAPNSFEQFMNLRQHRGSGGEASLEERLAQLEEHVDALIEHLMEALNEGLPQLQGQWQEMLHEHMGEWAQHFEGRGAPHADDSEHMHAEAERAYADALGSRRRGAGVPSVLDDDCACIGGSSECDCETEIRAYRLSEGKLKELTELMVLGDVPVLVSPQEDRIEVHGSAAQHQVFAAFVRMIDPKAERTRPPSRPDAPRSRGDRSDRAGNMKQHLASMRDAHRQLSQQARNQMRAAEHLSREAERVERRMEKLGDKAEQCEDKIDEAEGRERSELISKLEKMLAEIRTLEAQLVANEAQAETHEATAEAMEQEAENIESQIEDLEDAVADADTAH